jgi:hypothetical protein
MDNIKMDNIKMDIVKMDNVKMDNVKIKKKDKHKKTRRNNSRNNSRYKKENILEPELHIIIIKDIRVKDIRINDSHVKDMTTEEIHEEQSRRFRSGARSKSWVSSLGYKNMSGKKIASGCDTYTSHTRGGHATTNGRSGHENTTHTYHTTKRRTAATGTAGPRPGSRCAGASTRTRRRASLARNETPTTLTRRARPSIPSQPRPNLIAARAALP